MLCLECYFKFKRSSSPSNHIVVTKKIMEAPGANGHARSLPIKSNSSYFHFHSSHLDDISEDNASVTTDELTNNNNIGNNTLKNHKNRYFGQHNHHHNQNNQNNPNSNNNNNNNNNNRRYKSSTPLNGTSVLSLPMPFAPMIPSITSAPTMQQPGGNNNNSNNHNSRRSRNRSDIINTSNTNNNMNSSNNSNRNHNNSNNNNNNNNNSNGNSNSSRENKNGMMRPFGGMPPPLVPFAHPFPYYPVGYNPASDRSNRNGNGYGYRDGNMDHRNRRYYSRSRYNSNSKRNNKSNYKSNYSKWKPQRAKPKQLDLTDLNKRGELESLYRWIGLLFCI